MRSRLNLDNDLDEPRWMELCGVSCKHVNVPEMVGFCGDGREPCRIGHRHRPLDLFSRLFAPENALTWNLPFWPMSNSGYRPLSKMRLSTRGWGPLRGRALRALRATRARLQRAAAAARRALPRTVLSGRTDTK